ncbi:MAG: Tm-1-like ATP-binding domain-containing protein [Deltaproteobacteria bacterium]|nr:Tm-1-like ATP-binding domain-containing protein [Deltaproteobacteria bacterium]
MSPQTAIAVMGTFDSKGQEHLFLKEAIERRGRRVVTLNVGTQHAPTFTPDIDLRPLQIAGRDKAIAATIVRAGRMLAELYAQGHISGVISAGGGSGTYLVTSAMKALPLGVPKVMVSTVAAHDMAQVVGTKDITMMHSVGDLLGVNSLTGLILDRAAGAICGMTARDWQAPGDKPRIGLSMFGFINAAAQAVKDLLEAQGYEVVAFHANGIGGLALEELAAEGRFDAILDLAPHELADTLKNGYCKLIARGRLEPLPGRGIPRLLVPGGLDCAVLEFTRDNIPAEYVGRKVFFYDFRSAVHLSPAESQVLTGQLADKLNRATSAVKVLIPLQGWSAADAPGAPLHDPESNREFVDQLRRLLRPEIAVREVDLHINDPAFASEAARAMTAML